MFSRALEKAVLGPFGARVRWGARWCHSRFGGQLPVILGAVWTATPLHSRCRPGKRDLGQLVKLNPANRESATGPMKWGLLAGY